MHSDSRNIRSRRRRARLAVLATGLVLSITLLAVLQVGESTAIADSKPAGRFRPLRLLPTQPAIRNVPTLPAGKVHGQVSDTELVLGVVINNAARAYPINMLTGPSREIINDTLGGKAIAATW